MNIRSPFHFQTNFSRWYGDCRGRSTPVKMFSYAERLDNSQRDGTEKQLN